MSIEQLIKQGSIHPFTATRDEINRVLELARRDLTVAQEIIKETPDWSYSIAYNAVLQACSSIWDIGLLLQKHTKSLLSSCTSR